MRSSLELTELPGGRSFIWPADEIPPQHLWAYDHLLEHECGSLSCGKSVYRIVNDYRFVTVPECADVPYGVNAEEL